MDPSGSKRGPRQGPLAHDTTNASQGNTRLGPALATVHFEDLSHERRATLAALAIDHAFRLGRLAQRALVAGEPAIARAALARLEGPAWRLSVADLTRKAIAS